MRLPCIAFPIEWFPEINNPNPAITLEVLPRLVFADEDNYDQFDPAQFEEYNIPFAETTPRFVYEAKLKFLGQAKHVQSKEDVAANYPGLKAVLYRDKYKAIVEGNAPFYDISSQPRHGVQAPHFPAIIQMSDLFDIVGNLKPGVHRGKIIAGVDTEKRIVGRGQANLEARGLYILSPHQGQLMYIGMSDVYRCIEFYLRLHACPWFHAMLEDFISKLDDADTGEDAVETAANKSASTSSNASNDQGDASPQTVLNVAPPVTSLADKLAEAGLVSSAPVTPPVEA
jgi:hypothetical protein